MTVDPTVQGLHEGLADRSHVNDVEVRVLAWILDNFPLTRERDTGPTDPLLDSGIIDSLGTLELAAFLEREFGFIVEDEEMVADHFETIASITAFVKTKLEN